MGANRRFSRDSHTCTTWSPTSVAPSTLANVVWKSKEGKSRHATGCSISKSSRLEAFDERYHTPPLNQVECGISCTESQGLWRLIASQGVRGARSWGKTSPRARRQVTLLPPSTHKIPLQPSVVFTGLKMYVIILNFCATPEGTYRPVRLSRCA